MSMLCLAFCMQSQLKAMMGGLGGLMFIYSAGLWRRSKRLMKLSSVHVYRLLSEYGGAVDITETEQEFSPPTPSVGYAASGIRPC